MNDVIDAEVISNGRALAVSETVALPVSVEVALQQWQDYQELTRRLLDDSDYQDAGGGKKFKKKSAWRKYARAFNLTDRVTHEEIARDDDGWPTWARIRVTVTAPNGRTAEADHECHRSERCCPARAGTYCRKHDWRGHTCCAADCDGREHWAHPGDIAATATTRAKNRAISDMIGAGEVSAEEMDGQQETPVAPPAPNGRVRTPQAQPAAAKTRLIPSCPAHGQRAIKLVPAGVSKKTNKPYSAFYTCDVKGCEAGDNGRGFYVDADAWKAIHDTSPIGEYDSDDLPDE